MGNPYPANVGDPDGATRLSGEVTFTDPANQPGGSAAPTTRAIYNLQALAVSAASDTRLEWTFADGTALLDLSIVDRPVPLVSGIYAVTVEVVASAVVSPTAILQAGIVMDNDNLSPIYKNTAPMRAGSDGTAAVTAVFYNPAGSDMQGFVFHLDAGQTPDIFGFGFVQRIS